MLSLSLTVGMKAWAIVVPALIFTFGAAFIFLNAFAKAFTPFGSIAGYAGALYGGTQQIGGGILGAIVSHTPDTSALPLSIIFIAIPLLVATLYETVKNHPADEVF